LLERGRDDNENLTGQDVDSGWSRFFVFLIIAVTTIASSLLIAGLKFDWTIHGSGYTFIAQNRATASIVVQVLAGLLGVAHKATVRTLINYSSRESLCRRPMTLDNLDFWSSLTNSQIDWALPKGKVFLLLTTATFSLVPAGLWAGALTPIEATIVRTNSMVTEVPVYSNATSDIWSQTWYRNDGYKVRNSLGMFSYAPQTDRYGFLHSDGASASTIDGRPQLHKKNDNSNFTYYGRSYGAGALVGLANDSLTMSQGIISYEFVEKGYDTQVTCIYNATSNFQLSLIQSSSSGAIPEIFLAHGLPPRNPPIKKRDFTMVGFGGEDSIVAVATWGCGNNACPGIRIMYMAIATGDNYPNLNATQCVITWTPTLFSIEVDNLQRLITVKPLSGENVEDIDPTGAIAYAAAATAGALSMIDTTYYTSVLGDMFEDNVANVLLQQTDESNETKTLRAISETLEALVDDALVATASAQLIILQETETTPVVARLQALQIGQKSYIYAIAGVNAAILTFLCIEAIRSKGWRGLPRFNFANTKSVVVGSSNGGIAVANALEDEYHRLHPGHKRVWHGDPDDRTVGKIEVILSRTQRGLTLGLS
jgi:hypothetical protein